MSDTSTRAMSRTSDNGFMSCTGVMSGTGDMTGTAG